MVRKTVWLAACSPLLVGGGAVAQPQENRPPAGTQGESGRAGGTHAESAHAGGWTVVVVKLGYARAEDVARLLSQLAPPAVTVAAYEPTNSVIIAGDAAVLGKLTNEAKSSETQNKSKETQKAK